MRTSTIWSVLGGRKSKVGSSNMIKVRRMQNIPSRFEVAETV